MSPLVPLVSFLSLLLLSILSAKVASVPQIPPAAAALLIAPWKVPPAPLPGTWGTVAEGKNWKLCEWQNPTAFLGRTPSKGQAIFRDGKLVCLKITFFDRFAYRTADERRLEAELEKVNHTSPFDRKRWKALVSTELPPARRARDKEFSQTVGESISGTTKTIKKALAVAFPFGRYFLAFDTQGRDTNSEISFNGKVRYGNEAVVAVLDAEGGNLTLYLFRQPSPSSPRIKPAPVPAGDGGPEFLKVKIWDGPRRGFPEKVTGSVFGAVPLSIDAGGYYNPDVVGHIDRTSVADLRYLRSVFLMGTNQPRPDMIPKSTALRRQFEKSKNVEEGNSLLALEQKTRPVETAQVFVANVENARQFELTVLAQILNDFPITPENSSADSPFRFFMNEDFTAVLINTFDEVRLEIFRRIEKPTR